MKELVAQNTQVSSTGNIRGEVIAKNNLTAFGEVLDKSSGHWLSKSANAPVAIVKKSVSVLQKIQMLMNHAWADYIQYTHDDLITPERCKNTEGLMSIAKEEGWNKIRQAVSEYTNNNPEAIPEELLQVKERAINAEGAKYMAILQDTGLSPEFVQKCSEKQYNYTPWWKEEHKSNSCLDDERDGSGNDCYGSGYYSDGEDYYNVNTGDYYFDEEEGPSNKLDDILTTQVATSRASRTGG